MAAPNGESVLKIVATPVKPDVATVSPTNAAPAAPGRVAAVTTVATPVSLQPAVPQPAARPTESDYTEALKTYRKLEADIQQLERQRHAQLHRLNNIALQAGRPLLMTDGPDTAKLVTIQNAASNPVQINSVDPNIRVFSNHAAIARAINGQHIEDLTR